MIITNFGCPESGKTGFSFAMAHKLSKIRHNAQVLYINFNNTTPIMPLVFTDKEIDAEQYSIGPLLENLDINIENILSRIQISNSSKNIGILGYCFSDTPLKYSEQNISYQKYLDFFSCVDQMVDYVIIECPYNLDSKALLASIESSDVVNLFLTANPKGMLYFKNVENIFDNREKFKFHNFNYIIGNVKSYEPYEQVTKLLGNGRKNVLFVKNTDEYNKSIINGKVEKIYDSSNKSLKKAVDFMIGYLTTEEERLYNIETDNQYDENTKNRKEKNKKTKKNKGGEQLE